MEFGRSIVMFVFGGTVVGLIALIAFSEYFGLGYTGAIEASGSLLFSGLLVWLYHQQSQIMNNQEGLMEHQNQMMMESHRPQLMFEISGFKPKEDIVSYDVKNVGPGVAYDIGLELEFDPRIDGRETLVSYGTIVGVPEQEPTSLGVLRSGEEETMDFKISLSNPDQNGDNESLPVTQALSKFDYSEFKKARIYVKEVYSDARGEGWGSSVIEQIPFYSHEPVDNVESLWSYGLAHLDLEEAWIDVEED
ncbi:hypothetical protein ACFQJC_01545 [Haloferax namakaokahaiae]|uniref:Uncharacterized protein n=1 Tax=Haloferax namakaokahaiae TaxID=1748331 RepID=A0ABD5ZAG3_9EURY